MDELERMEGQREISIDSKQLHKLLLGLDVILEGQSKQVIKTIYKSFIEKVTFDKKEKWLKVHLSFSDDVVKELQKYDEEELLPKGNGSFFICI